MENLSGQARICLIFRGLFFEHNPSTIVPTYGAGRAGTDIGEKNSFRSGIIGWLAALTGDRPRQD